MTYGPHKHVVEGLIADVLNQAMRDLAIRNAVRAGF